MELLTSQVQRICTAAPAARIESVLPGLNASLVTADVTTLARAAMFVAQLAHESAEFSAMSENLNYSAAALVRLWPHHFPDMATALRYERKPQAIASRAYAGRLGNGDEQGGDGWRYRGRGAIQLTGADAYRDCGRFLGIDLLANPDMAATPAYAFEVAAWFWRVRGLNSFADAGDIAGATRRINGGAIGLAERTVYYRRARAALGC